MADLNSALSAMEFLLPPFILSMLIAGVVSLVFKYIASAQTKASVKLEEIFRLSVGFAAFAYVLGIFAALSGNKNTTAILGTVTTTASAYLVYFYGKDATPDAQTKLLPALVSFFLVTPMVIEYVRFDLLGGA